MASAQRVHAQAVRSKLAGKFLIDQITSSQMLGTRFVVYVLKWKKTMKTEIRHLRRTYAVWRHCCRGKSIFISLVMHAVLVGCGGSSGGGSVGPVTDELVDTGSSENNNEKELVRIMAVGDSITHGIRSFGPSASWRLPFTKTLDGDGCAYLMVGSQQTNELHSAFESAHEAYSTHEAGHFILGYTNWAGENEGIFASMQNHSPDVVLLHIGTNDVVQEQANPETIQEIDQIITTVLNNNADVLVANVIPSYTAHYLDGVDERIADLGSRIEAYVSQLGNERVRLVDVRSGYSAELMYEDGIHPNDKGSQHIADAFSAVYKAGDYCEF